MLLGSSPSPSPMYPLDGVVPAPTQPQPTRTSLVFYLLAAQRLKHYAVESRGFSTLGSYPSRESKPEAVLTIFQVAVLKFDEGVRVPFPCLLLGIVDRETGSSPVAG
ncbi:hypothetical protein AXG93_2175s1170 [Marchantia polymorpha subsp. ruderalis]|uniref:Uncharacterized protein n=1 Tax=Marchantia polymorpha subsp. ruderalis TaxID=1480154 RepID=A0A176W6C5_MARPO|nr:hypothetical protein AXG93_2175s1170 [Marchantia polymorpha subsp. ruderalis]